MKGSHMKRLPFRFSLTKAYKNSTIYNVLLYKIKYNNNAEDGEKNAE